MEKKRSRFWITALLLLLIFSFLLSYFEPRLLLSTTTPTGGDTPSHFTAAVLFRDFFLRHFQVTGWDYGNLAGYPLFQYYFPFPFILCAVLSLLLPITVSFKLTSVLGVFLLPFSAFYFLRKLRFSFPVPILGAAAMLPFLFVESQSMWGGNISSTLAGEFTYSLGMAIALVYLSSVYVGMESKSNLVKNAALLALAGFSHGCALLVAGSMPLFCVFQGSDTIDRIKYYVKVNVLAFLLLAFWLLPWVMSQEYMSPFNFLWVFRSWSELFPRILLPLYALAAFSGLYTLHVFFRKKQPDGRLAYLWFGVLVCLVFFYIGYQLNVVDIRFIPFLQLFVVLIAAAFLGSLIERLPAQWCFATAAVLLSLAWTEYNSANVRGWIKWNYGGFEAKPQWSVVRQTTSFLRGTFRDPRVVYEHSAQHDQFGSVRTFESLPYFAGRATLEGAYLQSSINSPFIFYLQSEVSEVTSCPLPDYHCAALDFKRALPHLDLFNASHLILRSDAAKQQARAFPDLVLEKTVGPLEIYRIANAGGHYVVPLACKPVLYTGKEWKRESFRWYRNYTPDSMPVVMDQNPAQEDLGRFARITEIFPVGEHCAPQQHRCRIEESIEHDRIRIKTSCIGHPLLIKVTYHPRWKVKGAAKVYLATPGFMLVFPREHDVELSFGWTVPNYLGMTLTTLVALGALLSVVLGRASTVRQFLRRITSLPRLPVPLSLRTRTWLWAVSQWLHSPSGCSMLKAAVATLAISFVLTVAFGIERNNSNILFEQGIECYFKEDFDTANRYFSQAAQANPESSHGIMALFHWGLSLYKQKRYEQTVEVFHTLVEQFPESMYAPESMYHIALSLQASGSTGYDKYFRRVIQQYPDSRWAQFAQERLKEANFDLGMNYFNRQDLEAAQHYFRNAAADRAASPAYRTRSQYFVAVCDFKRERWAPAMREFRNLILRYPDSDWIAEAVYHVGLCYANLGQKALAAKNLQQVVLGFPGSRWAGHAQERLKELAATR